jgi:hypothetical protein
MARTNDGTAGNHFGTVATKYSLPTNATFLWRCKLSSNVSFPIMGQRSNANYGFNISRSSATQSLRFTTFNFTDMDFTSSAWPSDGLWHSFMVTKSGVNYSFYVDNSTQGTAVAGGFTVPEADIPLGVSAYYYENTGTWDSIMGSIAEVAVFNRILTLAEQKLWWQGQSPLFYKSGLINYWKFDEKHSDVMDCAGALNLTQTGTMGYEAHPSNVSYPLPPRALNTGLDGVTITLSKTLDFGLSTGQADDSFDVWLDPDDGVLLVAIYSVLDDTLGGMGLSDQVADYETMGDSTAYAISYYDKVDNPHAVVGVGSGGNGNVTGVIYVFRVQGNLKLGNTGSWTLQSSNARTVQQPGYSTLVQLITHSGALTQTGLGQNSWRLLCGDQSSITVQYLPNATSGTTTFSHNTVGVWFEIVAKEKVRKQRFVTVREPWTTQPQSNEVAVDLANPLAQGFIGHVNCGTRMWCETPLTPGANPPVAVTSRNARGLQYNGNAYTTVGPTRSFYDRLVNPKGMTAAVLVDVDSLATYSGIVNCHQSNGATYNPFELRIGSASTDGKINVVRATASGYRQHKTGDVDVVAAGDKQLLIVVSFSSANVESDATIWVKRTKYVVAPFDGAGSGPAVPDYGAAHIGTRWDATTKFYGTLWGIWFWERPLTDAEVFMLYDNPWQVFKPCERRIHTPAPALTHKRRRIL